MRLLIDGLKSWARSLKRDVVALWIAARDPRTPWYAKVTAGAVAAYALSPMDLIPDIVPILGYLDDLIIVPLGIALALKMIPKDLIAEFRTTAERQASRPKSLVGMAVIAAVWLLAAGVSGWLIWRSLAQ